MNLDRYFSVPLFREGLRRLALPAAGLGIAVLLINTLGLLSDFSHGIREMGYDDYPYGLRLCPMLFPYMMLAPLILGLWQFRFLNHKDGVDFFLSAPATRAALFNAFSLAGLVLQWLTIALVVAVGVLVYHHYGVRLHGVDVLHAVFACGVGTFLGWALTACAAAVCTGALATTALAAIACFVPAILQLIIEELLQRTSLSAFVWPQAFPVTNNLFVDVMVNNFAGGGARTLVCSLALAAGCYWLGVYAFARRHGESGAHPGVVYPALTAAALFLAVLVPVLWAAVGGVPKDWGDGDWGWKFTWEPHELALACGLFALGFYAFAYCLVRRLRPLFRLTLLLPLALAVAALVVMGGMAWGARFRKAVPAADAVAAVTFLPQNNLDDPHYFFFSDFADLRTTDPRVCRRAAASLACSLKKSAENGQSSAEGRHVVRLELRDGTSLTRRVLFLRPNQEPSLRELLMADPANAAYWRLPGAGQVCGFDLQIGQGEFYRLGRIKSPGSTLGLRGDAPQWEAYRQEYAAAIASDPAAIAFWMESDKWHPRGDFTVAVAAKFRDRHGRIVERSFPIIPRLMPKTCDSLLATANHPFPILSQKDRECADRFSFCDLDALADENAAADISDESVYGISRGRCVVSHGDENAAADISDGRPDFRARLVALESFLAPIQARQAAAGKIANRHLVHCKLFGGFSGKQKGMTSYYDISGGRMVKHYFLFMTPEEIAKLRALCFAEE